MIDGKFRTALSGGRRLAAALMCCALLGGLGACSADDSDGPDDEPTRTLDIEEPVTADEVCDGALAGSAAGSLELMAQDSTFGETEGGEPPASLPESAQTLLDEGPSGTDRFCTIFSPRYTDLWFAILTFDWSPRVEEGTFPTEYPQEPYDAGVRAFVEGQGALLTVRCSVGGAHADSDLTGRFTVTPGAASTPDAMMDVLNSATRAMTEELGCAEEADLPEGAPRRLDS